MNGVLPATCSGSPAAPGVRPPSAGWEPRAPGPQRPLRQGPTAGGAHRAILKTIEQQRPFCVSVSVQNLKHSEATFSPPPSGSHSSLSPGCSLEPLLLLLLLLILLLLLLLLLLPCVGASLDGQFHLLGDEGGSGLCVRPLAALHHTSLEAGGRPAPLGRAHPGLSGPQQDARGPRGARGRGALCVQMEAAALAAAVVRRRPAGPRGQRLLARRLLLPVAVLLSVNAFYPELGLQAGLLGGGGPHRLQAGAGRSTGFTGSPGQALLL